jgi:hypothetical protein
MQSRFEILGLFLFLGAAVFAQDAISVGPGSFTGSVHFSVPPPIERAQVVAGLPYSADETETTVQTLADGTHITRANSTRKLYRDSAGRTRIERPAVQFPPGGRHAAVPVVIEITDPVEHVKYTLDTVNKIAHKQSLVNVARDLAIRRTTPRVAAAGAPALPAQPSGDEGPQVTREKLDSQAMEGLQVQGHRTTTVYPTDSVGNDRPVTGVEEDWRSPELKIDVLHTSNDPRFGEVTRKLTNLVRSEPDASLFRPPADYSIVEENGDFTIKWGPAN